jgi:Ca2+-binding EF-hand superfamily protein
MKKYSNFSPKQVELIKEKFELMCDEDLSLDKVKFKKLMKISTSEADRLFKFFDMDDSKSVDSYEFICGLALLS